MTRSAISDLSIRKLLNPRRLDAEAARRYFREFVGLAWPYAEPARAYVHNWHVDAIADHLQAVAEQQISRLLITVPPGHAKSLLVSVHWPAWQWVRNPSWRGIFTSYNGALATRDSVRCRALLTSDWFQQMFQPTWEFANDQNEKDWFENTRKGFRMAFGVGGKGTGFRGDCLVIDDPLSAKKQHSEAALHEVRFWFDQVMSSRLNDPATGAIVIIMQRLSERDLAAHVLDRGGYVHLNLPTEFDPRATCTTVALRPGQAAWQDPRTREGELLFPQLFPAEIIAAAKTSLGSQGYAAQHQQRPAPVEGGIIKRYWWGFWKPQDGNYLPMIFRTADGTERETMLVTLPAQVNELIQSWDCSFKDQKSSDYVVGQLWARLGADVYLLDQIRARLDLPGTINAIRRMSIKWPQAGAKLIEDKANGPAVMQCLAHELGGIIPVEPLGGKIARAYAVAPRIEAGNVYLPHPEFRPWAADLIEECAQFPNGRYDDQVDALSQALARLNDTPLMPAPEPYDSDEEEPRYFP
jgi:predicted phage terminase large subunit-like protein